VKRMFVIRSIKQIDCLGLSFRFARAGLKFDLGGEVRQTHPFCALESRELAPHAWLIGQG
jgi:hypothetical protein